MHGIKTSAPIHIIVHYPKSETGKRELARRVSGVHADLVSQRLQALNCPSGQKIELLDALIQEAASQGAGG